VKLWLKSCKFSSPAIKEHLEIMCGLPHKKFASLAIVDRLSQSSRLPLLQLESAVNIDQLTYPSFSVSVEDSLTQNNVNTAVFIFVRLYLILLIRFLILLFQVTHSLPKRSCLYFCQNEGRKYLTMISNVVW